MKMDRENEKKEKRKRKREGRGRLWSFSMEPLIDMQQLLAGPGTGGTEPEPGLEPAISTHPA
uniref:Uncharacterized protein n=1 Tax=Pristionchus pacificus TaxID=54126 RepID=A0A2A6CZX2_PRIPA|eukprot:PDM83583.1 hypothetical protein PRIPAC_30070 [Pristionchus pacificus]